MIRNRATAFEEHKESNQTYKPNTILTNNRIYKKPFASNKLPIQTHELTCYFCDEVVKVPIDQKTLSHTNGIKTHPGQIF